jgi:hypothetical protein
MNKETSSKKLLSPKAGALCVGNTKSPSTITNQGKRNTLSVLSYSPTNPATLKENPSIQTLLLHDTVKLSDPTS